LWTTADAGRVFIICAGTTPQSRLDALQRLGAGVIKVDDPRTALGLETALRALVKEGIQSVLVEGGSRVLGSFFDARMCDAVSIFVGAKILGGSASLGPLGGVGAAKIAESMALEDAVSSSLGSDVLINARCGSWPWL